MALFTAESLMWHVFARVSADWDTTILAFSSGRCHCMRATMIAHSFPDSPASWNNPMSGVHTLECDGLLFATADTP